MTRLKQSREDFNLTDTGPLVALLDKDDPNYSAVQEAQKLLPALPLLTTWPCFTEAMYLLGRDFGQSVQDSLWQWVDDEILVLHDLTFAERARMRTLMAKYADTPMDLADASLIVVAETRGLPRIFTVDSDFYVYRLADGRALEAMPGPHRTA